MWKASLSRSMLLALSMSEQACREHFDDQRWSWGGADIVAHDGTVYRKVTIKGYDTLGHRLEAECQFEVEEVGYHRISWHPWRLSLRVNGGDPLYFTWRGVEMTRDEGLEDTLTGS